MIEVICLDPADQYFFQKTPTSVAKGEYSRPSGELCMGRGLVTVTSFLDTPAGRGTSSVIGNMARLSMIKKNVWVSSEIGWCLPHCYQWIINLRCPSLRGSSNSTARISVGSVPKRDRQTTNRSPIPWKAVHTIEITTAGTDCASGSSINLQLEVDSCP